PLKAADIIAAELSEQPTRTAETNPRPANLDVDTYTIQKDAGIIGFNKIRISLDAESRVIALTPSDFNEWDRDYYFHDDVRILLPASCRNEDICTAIHEAFGRCRKVDSSTGSASQTSHAALLPGAASERRAEQSGAEKEKWVRVIEDLERLGFLRFVDTSHCSDVRTAILQDNDLLHEQTKRAFTIDAENILNRNGAKELFEEFRPFFCCVGLSDATCMQIPGPEGEMLCSIQDNVFPLSSPKDKNNPFGPFIRFLSGVNAVLRGCRVEEKAYLNYNTGNDAEVLFITPEMYDIVRKSGLLRRSEFVDPLPQIE
ncbi:MAG: hypothetical protein AAB288_05330, partial [Acidobacteriota bacterium]